MSAVKLNRFILYKLCNVSRLIGNILLLGVIICLDGIIYFTTDIPDYSSLQHYNPPTITRLYSQDLELLTEYSYEQRIFTKISEIPRVLINAFIATEDKTFFINYGIDPMSILRSTAINIVNLVSAKRAIGASTITQQVVQSFIVGKKRTLDRKIAEAIIAYRLSTTFSKEKILELYLNQIFLGNNAYGITAAARNYFNKTLSELNIAEVAMLASLPKAPSGFNPYTNPKRLLERRNWVIGRMYDEGMIGEDEMIEYLKYDLNVIAKKNHNGNESEFFYTEEVKKQLIQFYGENTVYTKGLVVNTNIDIVVQKQAANSLKYGIEAYDKRHGWRGPLGTIQLKNDWKMQLESFSQEFIKQNGRLNNNYEFAIVLETNNKAAVIGRLTSDEKFQDIIPINNLQWAKKGKIRSVTDVLHKGDVIIVSKINSTFKLEQIPKVNGAIVVIENYTGKVLGLVGGYNPNTSYFNRATQAYRQPGSVFKTMIYLTAIENGFTKDSILLDEPMSISQGNGMPAWEPQNLTHKFNGPVSLQEAFIRSLNMPAIQIGVSVGLDKIYKTASRLGVYPAPQNDQIPCKLDNIAKKYCTNYSLLLGAFETTLMNLTTAYATIASGGYLIKPILIDKIYDNQGNVLYKDSNLSIIANNDSPNIQVFKDKIIKNNAVDKMIDLLHKAVPRTKVTIIGKTGTTNDSFDTWFIGSSKDFTVGIFIGYDLPKSLGKHEIGAVVARPVFMHFIDNMSKYITDGPIGSNHPGIEMINTNDTLEELEDEQAIECIELMKTPHQLKYNDYDDDAYRTKNYIN